MEAIHRLAPVALVLGGTNAHVFLIQLLKAREYRVILIDYLANPPAAPFADLHIQASTLDLVRVEELAIKQSAELVISTSVDQANITACYVSERLGLASPYSYETAKAIGNKVEMKRRLFKAGVPTTRYFVAKTYQDLEQQLSELEFPVVIKPSDSNGSKGVRAARYPDEVYPFFDNAKSISRNGDVIVEEYFEGLELSLDCFVAEGVGHFLVAKQKFNVKIPGSNLALQCYASIGAVRLSNTQLTRVQNILDRIIKEFQLVNTSLMIQVLVQGDEINVIEFAARVGGGLSGRTVKLLTGLDIVAATVDSYLGNKVDLVLSMSQTLYLTSNVYATESVLGCISGVEDLMADGTIHEAYIHKNCGDSISSRLESRDRVMSFISKGSNRAELVSKVANFFKRISITDQDGKSILREDIKFNSDLEVM